LSLSVVAAAAGAFILSFAWYAIFIAAVGAAFGPTVLGSTESTKTSYIGKKKRGGSSPFTLHL
jgi:hypothetical protein